MRIWAGGTPSPRQEGGDYTIVPGPGTYDVKRLFESPPGTVAAPPVNATTGEGRPPSTFGTAMRFTPGTKEPPVPENLIDDENRPAWDTAWLRMGPFSGTFSAAARRQKASTCTPGPKYDIPGMGDDINHSYGRGVMQGVGSQRFVTPAVDDEGPGPGAGAGHPELPAGSGAPRMPRPHWEGGPEARRFHDRTVLCALPGEASPGPQAVSALDAHRPERPVRRLARRTRGSPGSSPRSNYVSAGDVTVYTHSGAAVAPRAETSGGPPTVAELRKHPQGRWARSERWRSLKGSRGTPGPAEYSPSDTAVRKAAPRCLFSSAADPSPLRNTGGARRVAPAPSAAAAAAAAERRRPATAPAPQQQQQQQQGGAEEGAAPQPEATPAAAPAPAPAAKRPPRRRQPAGAGRDAAAASGRSESRGDWLRTTSGPGPGDYTIDSKQQGRSCTIHAPVALPRDETPGPGEYSVDRPSTTGKPFRDGKENCSFMKASRFVEARTDTPLPFRDAWKGDVIRMTPWGFEPRKDVFLGTVLRKEPQAVVVKWKVAVNGGPPATLDGAPFPRVTTEAQKWWDGPGQARRDCAPGPGHYNPKKLPQRTAILHGRNTTKCPDISAWVAAQRERERELLNERKELVQRLVITGDAEDWSEMRTDLSDKPEKKPVGEPRVIFYS